MRNRKTQVFAAPCGSRRRHADYLSAATVGARHNGQPRNPDKLTSGTILAGRPSPRVELEPDAAVGVVSSAVAGDAFASIAGVNRRARRVDDERLCRDVDDGAVHGMPPELGLEQRGHLVAEVPDDGWRDAHGRDETLGLAKEQLPVPLVH